ncbi:hypothetical protein PUN28_007753 [Cardiocondyla obscurior]|uniref:Uncharacterized protein n=1 Tax=Cardiocondyla obscurior TaxID=286306 RepID=A0AAW2FU17_9HYME
MQRALTIPIYFPLSSQKTRYRPFGVRDDFVYLIIKVEATFGTNPHWRVTHVVAHANAKIFAKQKRMKAGRVRSEFQRSQAECLRSLNQLYHVFTTNQVILKDVCRRVQALGPRKVHHSPFNSFNYRAIRDHTLPLAICMYAYVYTYNINRHIERFEFYR